MGPVKNLVNYKKQDNNLATQWSSWKKEKRERKRKKEERLLASLDMKDEEKKEADVVVDDVPDSGRTWTLSIALPGNILDNAQRLDLKTLLAGQIARAAAIFSVDEIIIFDENGSYNNEEDDIPDADLPASCVLMARLLQYQECPQYLRKYFFPEHKDLFFVGLLNPLGIPHHYFRHEKAQFREGYVTEKTKNGNKSMVDVGLEKPIPIDTLLTPGLRVTVEMLENEVNPKKLNGKVVSPSTPQLKNGTYWGYNVRLASSLGAVLTQSPYENGYDLSIGTSERGNKMPKKFGNFKHAIMVFGGLQGLELGVSSDTSLNVDDPSYLFDYYLNTCPNQGSRTIRTEEAILVTLSALRPAILKANNN